jgi:uncharacterized protein YeaO (DUF488 family)
LVDRLWPRGLSRIDATFDTWLKDVAPSTELRKWYGHVPARFAEFDRRYRRELVDSPAREALRHVRQSAGGVPVDLLTATKDLEHSAAAVLRAVLADVDDPDPPT